MRHRATFVITVALFGALAAGYVQAVPTDPGKEVRVINSATEAVPVAIQGTSSVEVNSSAASPIRVQDVRQPFQQYVEAGVTEPQTFLVCDRVDLPQGKAVTIEGLTVSHILVPAGEEPEISLRVDWKDDQTLHTQTIAAAPELRPQPNSNPNVDQYTGFAPTLFHSSSAGGQVEYMQVCSDNAPVQFTGYVSGYVE